MKEMKKWMMCLMLLVGAGVSVLAQEGNFAHRFDNFVKDVAARDSLSQQERVQVDSTYKAYLAEYRVVKDSLSDADVRTYSKAKVRYQKEMARLAIGKASDDVADTAEDFGKKVSKVFRKTKSKVQGAIEALKE